MSDIDLHRAHSHSMLQSLPPVAQKPWDTGRHWDKEPRDKTDGRPMKIDPRPVSILLRSARSLLQPLGMTAAFDGDYYWLEADRLYDQLSNEVVERIANKKYSNDSSKGYWGVRNSRSAISFIGTAFEWALYEIERWQREK